MQILVLLSPPLPTPRLASPRPYSTANFDRGRAIYRRRSDPMAKCPENSRELRGLFVGRESPVIPRGGARDGRRKSIKGGRGRRGGSAERCFDDILRRWTSNPGPGIPSVFHRLALRDSTIRDSTIRDGNLGGALGCRERARRTRYQSRWQKSLECDYIIYY